MNPTSLQKRAFSQHDSVVVAVEDDTALLLGENGRRGYDAVALPMIGDGDWH